MRNNDTKKFASDAPMVSVIMAALNESQRIKKTVDSILEQTFQDFEFIIVDDGSTDNTLEILEQYANKDNRIKILKNEVNKGLVDSLNRGIESANSRYIARIDAGDIAYHDRLKKQIDYLEMRPEVSILGTQAYWINEKGEIIGVCRFPLEPDAVKGRIFSLTSVAVHPSLLIRNDLFNTIGLYDPYYNDALEYELYFRALSNGYKIANLAEFLMKLHRATSGISIEKIHSEFKQGYKARLRYLREFISLKNIILTLSSFIFVLIPSFLLVKIVDLRIRLTK